MKKHNGNREYERVCCSLEAECIKISGRSDVFCARSNNCSPTGLNLISPKAVRPGTYLVVRIKNLSSLKPTVPLDDFTATGLAEVRWVEEIMDIEGMVYTMGLKYLYLD